jgi:molybdenum cofactor cytidylyltransferase
MTTGGIVLAAGAGSRFGGAKQLARFRGRSLITHAVRAQVRTPAIDRVVVVLGAHAGRILMEADLLGADPVVCPDWAEGRSASLRAGIEALPEADAFVVTLGDQPLVNPAAVARIAAEAGTCRAAYHGRPGHPVRLTREDAERARAQRGDRGARDVLGGARLVECADLSSPDDVDTVEDLEALTR